MLFLVGEETINKNTETSLVTREETDPEVNAEKIKNT
jgi:hypothetical protein